MRTPPHPDAPAPGSPGRTPAAGGAAALVIALTLLALSALAETLLAPRALWGTTILAFAPRALWLLPVLVPLAALLAPRLPRPTPVRGGAWLSWAAGAVGAAGYWLAHERHRFWGDATALAVNLPQGQRFHPDEPLTLWLHHLLVASGLGGGDATRAVAIGSALAGGVFVGLAVHAFRRRLPHDGLLAGLAAATLATQGFTAVFQGHVENYAYVAVAILATLLAGAEARDGRRGPLAAVLLAVFALALHVLGALLALPVAWLVVAGLVRPATRRPAAIAALAGAAVLAGAAFVARPLYGGDSPLLRLASAPLRVLTNPTDSHVTQWLSAHQLANVWSHLQLVGPVGIVVLLLACIALWRGPSRPSHAWLAASGVLLYAPIALIGEGNLGAARNWDLFAAPAVAPALAAIVWITERLDGPAARRVMLVALAASLAHLAPWVAVNTSRARIEARVAALPLPGGRAPMMLGTEHLNRGELPEAERAFRAALALEPTNPNAQSGLGLALARQGRFDEADAPLREAVRLKPTVPQHHYDLIALDMQRGRWRDAESELGAVLALEPDEPRSWRTLAECQFQLGHPDTAAWVLENAASRLPANGELRAALADAYVVWLESAERAGDVRAGREAWFKLRQYFPADERRRRWDPVFAR